MFCYRRQSTASGDHCAAEEVVETRTIAERADEIGDEAKRVPYKVVKAPNGDAAVETVTMFRTGLGELRLRIPVSRAMAIAMIALPLVSCSTLKNINIGGEFEKSSRSYIQLVRWQEFESAAVTYVSPSSQEAYRERIKAAGEVKVADYRVKMMECDPVKGEATVKVEFDYYRPPSTRVHTVEDLQKWAYEGENDRHIWRLKSLLPEFK